MWTRIKNNIGNCSFGELAWGFLMWGFCVVLIILIFSFAFSTKSIKGYYLCYQATQAGLSYGVRANIEWFDDPIVFSTTDPNLALSVLRQLQEIESNKK